MLSCLVAVFFLAGRIGASNYESFNAPFENTPLENRKSIQNNQILGCDREDLIQIVGLSDIEEMVEAFAARKSSTPLTILRMLQKRMRNREESMLNSIELIPDLPPMLDIPPPMRINPIQNGAAYSLPSQDKDTRDENVVIFPVVPSQNSMPNRLIKTDFGTRNDVSDNFGTPFVNQVIPAMFSPLKTNQLRPPFGATVRVNSNDSLSPLSRDITVTISPLMTVIEALRQAELKYQNALGFSHETDVFSFAHSSMLDCYMINQINGMSNNEEQAWKVTVTDRESQVTYSNFCLPTGRDALVKPGALISLSYVPL